MPLVVFHDLEIIEVCRPVILKTHLKVPLSTYHGPQRPCSVLLLFQPGAGVGQTSGKEI